jgi:hypothetical protein
LATDHQHGALAARALEFEHRAENPSQQLATIAAQIASNRIVEMYLFQIGVHARGSLGWMVRVAFNAAG